MPTVTKTAGPAKRYGARYGPNLRRKAGELEKSSRARHRCPYCHYVKVRRQAAGIWHCHKCQAKFASRAYTVAKMTPRSS